MSNNLITISTNTEWKEALQKALKKHDIQLTKFVRQLVLDGHYEHATINKELDIVRKVKNLHSSLDQFYKFYVLKLCDPANKNKVEKFYFDTRTSLDKYVQNASRNVTKTATESDEIFRDFLQLRDYETKAFRSTKTGSHYKKHFLQLRLDNATRFKLNDDLIRTRINNKNQYLIQLINEAVILLKTPAISDKDFRNISIHFSNFNDVVHLLNTQKKDGKPVSDSDVLRATARCLQPIKKFCDKHNNGVKNDL